MKKIILEAFKDDNTGEVGLGLLGMPRDENTNAGDALLIAHDIIEHVNGPSKIGTIDDEMEALGAIWYVRGQHEQLRRNSRSNYTIEQSIASDVTRMFRDHLEGGQYVDFTMPRTHAVRADSYLQTIMLEADSTFMDEFDDAVGRVQARIKWPRYRALCLARMRVGYAKARRRWERKGQYAANNQFWAIHDAVELIGTPELEGRRYILRYGNGEAMCEVDYSEFE